MKNLNLRKGNVLKIINDIYNNNSSSTKAIGLEISGMMEIEEKHYEKDNRKASPYKNKRLIELNTSVNCQAC